MSDIRIIIADEDIGFAMEMSYLLESHPLMLVDSLVTSVDAVMEQLGRRPPDIVIMDMTLDGFAGAETAALISRESPRTKVLLLSEHDDHDLLAVCSETGAVCVPKDLEPAEMLRTVAAVGSGASLIAPTVVAHTVPGAEEMGRDPEDPSHSFGLSPREVEILRLLAESRTIADIGQSLSLSEAIVHNHLSNICHKLHVVTQAEATAKAAELHLLRP